jgi:hypothetical protein
MSSLFQTVFEKNAEIGHDIFIKFNIINYENYVSKTSRCSGLQREDLRNKEAVMGVSKVQIKHMLNNTLNLL